MWTLFSVIAVFVLSTGVQAQELTDVPASDILKQIDNEENIFLQNVNITGKLDLSKIDLKTVPSAWSTLKDFEFGLEKELKIVESNIIIQDSVFEEDVDFSNTEFREYIDFRGTTFFGEVDSEAANFAGYACFGGANFTGDADFWDVNFAGYASFAGANFAGGADFKDANFTGNATFLSTEFDEVYFTGTTFTNVSLIETDFNQMNVEWSTLKDALVFDGLAYIRLIKNFR